MFKNICEKFDAQVLQQLYKKITAEDNTLADKDVFPVTLVQGVYDAISGMRLDDVLTHYNYINLEYKGSQEATRLAIPIAHRRASLIISYTDYDGKTWIEQYNGDTINDEDWQNSNNWSTPFTEGNFAIYVTDEQLEIYINKYLDDKDIISIANTKIDEAVNEYLPSEAGTEIITNTTNTWISENVTDDDLKKFIDEYLDGQDLTSTINNKIEETVNEYLPSEAGTGVITDATTDWMDKNITADEIEAYINNYLDKQDLNSTINNKIEEVVNNYLPSASGTEAIENATKEWLLENISTDELQTLIALAIQDSMTEVVANYLNSDDGKQVIRDAVDPIMEELLGEYFEAFSTYVSDNERVIANALARHEQAITDLQNA